MDDILDKIAKLQAKAKGTNNQNEAEIFAAKVQELLAEHNLTQAQLDARGKDNTQGPVGKHPFGVRCPDRWREIIFTGVASLYFCQPIKMGKNNYVMIGREHNATVAVLMAEYLFATVKRMAREHSGEKSVQGNFRKGAALRLQERMRAMREKATVANVKGSNLPALYNDEGRAIEEWKAKNGFSTVAGKSRAIRVGAGGAEGRAAADRIGLNTQVTRETRQSRMLR